MNETINGKQLASEAKAAYKQGDYLNAALAYDAAAQSYHTAGDILVAAEMRNNSSVAYLMSGDAVAALSAVEGTPEIFADLGDIRRQGLAYGNLAAALEALERLEEAQKAYEQSAEFLKLAGEPDLGMHSVQALSALQLKRGQQLEALATMQTGLADVKNPNPKQRFLKKLLRVPMRFLGRSTSDE